MIGGLVCATLRELRSNGGKGENTPFLQGWIKNLKMAEEGEGVGESKRDSRCGALRSLSCSFATLIDGEVWRENGNVGTTAIVLCVLIRIPFCEFLDSILEQTMIDIGFICCERHKAC